MNEEDLIAYIEALETANDQLETSLKRCIKLLVHAPPPLSNQPEWQRMIEDFEKLVKIGERVIRGKKVNRS